MRGPRLGSGPQRWRSCELADDGVAQMGSSLAPSSLLLYGPCSLITADECGERGRERGTRVGKGREGVKGGCTQAGDSTRRGTCGRSSAPSGTT